jgi:hypothetical protein
MSGIRARWFTLALILATRIEAQVQHFDLKSFGYILPAKKPASDVRPHAIAMYPNGNLVVSFVTGKQPGLLLHLITWNRKGEFLNEKKIPTTDRRENGIFATEQGKLLVQTASTLKLYSANGDVLAVRHLAGDRSKILPIPGGQAFALISDAEDIELLDAANLTSSKKCSEMAPIKSVSEHNVLLDVAVSRFPPMHRLELHEICGATEFGYEWGELPDSVVLLDDTRIALTGPNVVLMSKEAKLWTESFKDEVAEGAISASGDGDLFAIALINSNARPKSLRIIVYSSKAGKHVADAAVDHWPNYGFDFALAPDGKVLAILTDRELQVVPIPLP